MRPLRLAGGIALVLTIVGRLPAEPVPYNATVTATEAEVRSGPSTDPRFYPTNRLRKGDVVQVVREGPKGWLAVRPPEGSYSWINAGFVKQMTAAMPNNFVVDCRPGDTVEVRIGSELGQGKPTVVGCSLQRSAQVRLFQRAGQVTRASADADGTWLPIEPPAAELRYLRADAIAAVPTTTAPAVAQSREVGGAASGASSSAFTPAPSTLAATPSSQPTHAEVDELYNKAVLAERSGDVRQAIQLYAKAGSLGAAINSTVASQALARAHYLDAAASGTPAPVDSRFAPMASTPAPPPRVSLATPTTQGPAGATFSVSRQASEPGTSPYVGQLRRSGRGKFNLPTYVLVNTRAINLYANPAEGVDLESYVGRNVELFGRVGYDGELRANYMIVSQVRLLQ